MSRNYLEAFVIVLISAGLGFFLALPKYSELQEIKMQVAQKTAEIENRQEYFAELSQAAIELSQYEANLEKIESAFPQKIDAPALMNFVQTAAMQSGLIVKSIDFSGNSLAKTDAKTDKKSPDNVGPSLKLNTYSVDGEFIGSYSNFKDFLSRLEFSSRLINAETVTVAAETATETASSQKNLPKNLGTSKEGDEAAAIDPILNFSVTLSVNYYK